jgi:predicted AlkP superfamily pyrophosphatase or phosphodiesterase
MSPSLRRRALIPFVLLVTVVATLVMRPGAPANAQASDQDLIKAACSIPHEWLLRTWRGWRADRGAQISWIPREPDFVGSGLPHVGPWGYVQDVPMLWYGPGYIKAQPPVQRPVTLAGIAPTQGLLTGYPFKPVDGQPMTEAVLPAADRPNPKPPKLLVTLVWDAGGMDTLQAHPSSWPYLKSLIDKGTFYTHATVGSSPTSTAQDHAIIGTGAFPDHHGLVGHHFQIGGKLTTPWNDGPAYLILPTFADLFDQAHDNKPVVGVVGTVDIHFGMLGHGSFMGGGDRDIALTRSVIGADTLTDEGFEWNLPIREAPYYELPTYANDVPGLKTDVRKLDQADGKLDGKWRDNDIQQLLQGFDTPARTPYQERVVETVVKREGFGKDDMTDLLFLNFKEIDYVSHVWSMNSPEMQDAVVAQDQALKRFVAFLNQQVGKGNWAMVLTADHGAMPDPAVSGGFQISTAPIQNGINETFDKNGDNVPIVELVQPSQVFINTDELAKNGYTLDDVSRYVAGLTQAQTTGGGVTPIPGHANDKVFQAVFPSALMQNLPCLPEARK